MYSFTPRKNNLQYHIFVAKILIRCCSPRTVMCLSHHSWNVHCLQSLLKSVVKFSKYNSKHSRVLFLHSFEGFFWFCLNILVFIVNWLKTYLQKRHLLAFFLKCTTAMLKLRDSWGWIRTSLNLSNQLWNNSLDSFSLQLENFVATELCIQEFPSYHISLLTFMYCKFVTQAWESITNW